VTADQILIFTAVTIEARSIQRTVRLPGTKVQAVGIGAKHLPEPSQLKEIQLILLCGVAGALDPSLAIGDVVLDDPDGLCINRPIYRRGQIHTSSRIIATPQEKAGLFAETGALAVDMEQQIVRDFAKPLGIRVIGLRAISDTAGEILDPAVVGLVDELGRAKPLAIASTLIRRPTLIPYLNRLNANTKLALKNLADTVQVVLAVLAESI
jgi:adenosylhomocysteine nucleosidase